MPDPIKTPLPRDSCWQDGGGGGECGLFPTAIAQRKKAAQKVDDDHTDSQFYQSWPDRQERHGRTDPVLISQYQIDCPAPPFPPK
jgi:hypothetical protein